MISRRYLAAIIAAIVTLVGQQLGLPLETIEQILAVLATLIPALSVTNGLNPQIMGLPEKWKSRRLWTAVATIIVVVVGTLTGLPEQQLWYIVGFGISVITGVTIEDAIAAARYKKR